MKTAKEENRQFEFCFPLQDTLVLVEETDSEVVIRATRDSFTSERKSAFLHELALEGFISDKYRWASSGSEWGSAKARWVVDYSWLKISDEILQKSKRLMVTLYLSSSGLWLIMMSVLFLFARR